MLLIFMALAKFTFLVKNEYCGALHLPKPMGESLLQRLWCAAPAAAPRNICKKHASQILKGAEH